MSPITKVWNHLACIAVLALIFSSIDVTRGAPGDEKWNYTEVRPGAHMFWWLMYSRAEAPTETLPLIIWIGGGPGAASTGYGNIEEIGPFNFRMEPRNITWVDHAHLLLPDSPVGTGHSYVNDTSLVCQDEKTLVADLVIMLKDVLTNYAPELAASPIYIIGESYAGKTAPQLGLELVKAVEAGKLSANMSTVIIRDGWVSGEDIVAEMANYALSTGLVDDQGAAAISAAADKYVAAIHDGRWNETYSLLDETLSAFLNASNGVNIYYILDPVPFWILGGQSDQGNIKQCGTRTFNSNMRVDEPFLPTLSEEELNEVMNGPIREKLAAGVPYLEPFENRWTLVQKPLEDDIHMPVIDIVEKLLTDTDVHVAVVTGQLDYIVPTPGTLRWVRRLQWPGAQDWQALPREPVIGYADKMEGYVKKNDRLSLWWVNHAGHSTFYFNPLFGQRLLEGLRDMALQ